MSLIWRVIWAAKSDGADRIVMKTKLTEAIVRAAKPSADGKQHLIWDTEIKGLGLLCSRTVSSFVVQRRNVRKTLGRWPMLSVAAARQRAIKKLGEIDDERNQPISSPRLTLEQALGRYLEGMRQRECGERSIAHLRDTTRRYLWDWRNKHLQDISRQEVVIRHSTVGQKNGMIAANAAMRALRCIWNDAMLIDNTLPPSPTIALKRRWFKERRRQEPVSDLVAWATRVAKLENPIRRSLQWFLLLTGLRSWSSGRTSISRRRLCIDRSPRGDMIARSPSRCPGLRSCSYAGNGRRCINYSQRVIGYFRRWALTPGSRTSKMP